MSAPDRVRIPWPRLSLLDMMVIVLAAGVSSGLARGAKAVWVDFPAAHDRAVGAATMVLAVWLCLPLVRQSLGMIRSSSAWHSRRWPVAWRLAFALGAAMMVVEQWLQLRVESWHERFSPMDPPPNPFPIFLRSGLLPILAAIGMAGVVCAMSPTRRPFSPGKSRLSVRVLIVPLVAIAGLLMAGTMAEIPYLIVIAVDGVTNALTSRSGRALPDIMMRYAPTLNDRMARAGWECLPSLFACSFLGMFLSHDLRRDLSDEPLTWRAMLPRIAALAACVIALIRLCFSAIPSLHPSLYEGMALTFEGRDVAALAGAFAVFGAGLSARAVSPRVHSPAGSPAFRRAGRRLVTILILGLTSFSLLGYGANVPIADSSGVPGLRSMLDVMAYFYEKISKNFPMLIPFILFCDVKILAWALGLAWLAAKIVAINLRKPGADVAPLDGIAESRGRLGWFLWCTSAVTILFLTALPTLALGGLTVIHCRMHMLGFFAWIHR